MTDLSGQVVKGYELRQQIGKGGFGEVYRAYQPTLHRDVAVKVIRPEFANRPEFIRRFEAEAQTIARLEHPYIVPLYEYWRDESGAYLVMRWLRGGSLRKTLRQGPLASEAILRVFDQISAALASAHRSGVVHRDFKPDNILLDEDGNAYLSDFGIAIDVSSIENIQSDKVVGSVAYMSPEQVRGDAVTPSADIYSLGVVLYELLTGKQPFADVKTMEVLHHHLLKPLPSVRLIRPELSTGLDDVIQRATAKDIAKRYPDAVSLAAALRQQLSLEVVTRDLTAQVYERAEAIPNQPQRLIGRDALLDQTRQSLEEQRIVLLYGFGGIGKTTLATVTAVEHLKAGKGSVIWLEVGTNSADVTFEALGRGFGEGQSIASKTGPERIEAVRSLLESKQALLVLDNVWNDQALFQTLKAVPPNIRVLITSRHAIPLEGAIIDVAELSADKALELLGYYAGKSYTNSSDAKALCKRLGYHTFALEIAGKILKIERHLTPERLMSRMAAAPHDLRVPGSFADVGRESVKDLLDTSVNELSERQRTVFTMMGGLFAPRASLKLLTGVLDNDEGETEALVADLQQRGLAELIYGSETSPDHYRLHDLTYSYAHALFRSKQPNNRAVIAAVQKYVDDFTDDYDKLDFEQNNILEAARSAQEEGDSDSLIHIMTRLNIEGNYFATRGHSPLALTLLRQSIDAAAEQRQIATTHYLWSRLGNAYANYLGDLDKALNAYQEAVRLAVLMGDTRRQALALAAIGTIHIRQASTEADKYLQAAYRLAKTHNDDVALSQVLEYLGYQAAVKQTYEAAHKYYLESYQVAERLQNEERMYFALLNLGAAQQELGNFDQALLYNQRACQLAQANNSLSWEGYALQGMGEAYHGMQSRKQAELYFYKALQIYLQINATVKSNMLTEIMHTNGYDFNLSKGEQ